MLRVPKSDISSNVPQLDCCWKHEALTRNPRHQKVVSSTESQDLTGSTCSGTLESDDLRDHHQDCGRRLSANEPIVSNRDDVAAQSSIADEDLELTCLRQH